MKKESIYPCRPEDLDYCEQHSLYLPFDEFGDSRNTGEKKGPGRIFDFLAARDRFRREAEDGGGPPKIA